MTSTSLLTTTVNLFKDYKKADIHSKQNIAQVMQWIKYGKDDVHRQAILSIRQLDKSTQAKEVNHLKTKLPLVHYSYNAATISNRKIDSVKSAEDMTGYHFFDVDGYKGEELQKIYDMLQQHPEVACCWYSSSGQGVGGLLKIEWLKNVLPYNTEEVNSVYKTLMYYTWYSLGLGDIKADPAGFLVTQANYLSYDKTAKIELNRAVTVQQPSEEELVKFLTNCDQLVSVKKPIQSSTKAIKAPSTKRYNIQQSVLLPFHKAILDRIYNVLIIQPRLYKTGVLPTNPDDLTTISSNTFVAHFIPRAYQYSIPLTIIQQYLRAKNRRFINNDSVEGANFKEGSYGWDSFISNHSPAFITDTIILKPEEWLSDYYNFDSFKKKSTDTSFKVIINATTGLGKNVAVIKNSRQRRTIIAVPSNSLVDSVVAEAAVLNNTSVAKKVAKADIKVDFNNIKYTEGYNNKDINYDSVLASEDTTILDGVDSLRYSHVIDYNSMVVRQEVEEATLPLIVKKWDGRFKERNLSTADLIVTTYNSLSGVVNTLMTEGANPYTDYILVVDEVHTFNYDSFKELAGANTKPLSNLLEEMEVFDNVVALTGTLNSNTISTFEEWKVINFKRATPAIKTDFCYIQKKVNATREDVLIVKDLVAQGYFPVIFKNSKQEDGWYGEFKTLLRVNGKEAQKVVKGCKILTEQEPFNVATLNTDYMEDSTATKAYNQIIKDRSINAGTWDAVVMTSFVREGVSTNLYGHSTGKVAYIIFMDSKSPMDTDVMQQISQRVRNATEIKIVVVYGAATTLLPRSYFKYEDTKAKVLKEADRQLKLVKQLFGQKMTTGLRAERLQVFPKQYLINREGEWQVNSLYVSWEVTRKRCHVEGKNPSYAAWLGNFRFGWNDLGLVEYDREGKRLKQEEAAMHKALSKAELDAQLQVNMQELTSKYRYGLISGKKQFMAGIIEDAKTFSSSKAQKASELMSVLGYLTVPKGVACDLAVLLGNKGVEEEVESREVITANTGCYKDLKKKVKIRKIKKPVSNNIKEPVIKGLLNTRNRAVAQNIKLGLFYKIFQADYKAGKLTDGGYDGLYNDLFNLLEDSNLVNTTTESMTALCESFKADKYFEKYSTHYKYNKKERAVLLQLLCKLYYKIEESGKDRKGNRTYTVLAQDFYMPFEEAGFTFLKKRKVNTIAEAITDFKDEATQSDDIAPEFIELDYTKIYNALYTEEEEGYSFSNH